MAYSNIDKPSKYFNTVTYSGNSTDGRSLTGVGFKPDLVWIKIRSTTGGSTLQDIVRGANKFVSSNSTNAETTDYSLGYLSSFTSDGFVLEQGSDPTDGFLVNNATGQTYVSWNWLGANTTTSNTQGTITSTVSANTTSGFSIVSYSGTGANATVGHGLGVAPKMIIFKSRNSATSWPVYHASLGATNFVALSNTDASSASSLPFNNTAPTSTVFSLGTSGGTNSTSMIAYCFAEVKGYSKFGSYVGNGNADGTFVYTGFKPAFVMTKSSSTGGTYYDWGMMDNKRANPFNVIDAQVCANLSDQENSANIGSQKIDFLSNGFKPRVNGSSHNGSGVTYIYMCFAENPFVSSKGIPACAR